MRSGVGMGAATLFELLDHEEMTSLEDLRLRGRGDSVSSAHRTGRSDRRGTLGAWLRGYYTIVSAD